MGYRLLFITHSLNNTGAPLVLWDAINACKKAGHIIDVVAMEDGPLREVMERNGIFATVADSFLTELAMWQRIFSKYDAVIANTLVCIEAVYALNTTKVPTLWWIHEHEYWFKQYQNILPKETELHHNIRVYGVSPVTEEYIKKYCGYETRLLTFGIRDVRSGMLAAEDENIRKVRFICPATYCRVKGQDLLCEAVCNLSSEIREASEFVMCGATIKSEYKYYEGLLDIEHDNKEITILDALNHDDALSLMNKCDYVIVPSRLEPFSVTAVEAMMLGKIPVLSNICGVTHWIKNGENGFVFESENVAALTRVLEQCVLMCLNKNYTWSMTAENARKTYEEYFSMDVFSDNFMKELAFCIEGKDNRHIKGY